MRPTGCPLGFIGTVGGARVWMRVSRTEGSVPDGSAVRDVAYAVLATAAFLTG